MAPATAALLARELHKDQTWIDSQVASFNELALQYTLQRTATEAVAQ
jgi:glycerol-3-phosphate dehydrogenase